jgi:hypothetical protein
MLSATAGKLEAPPAGALPAQDGRRGYVLGTDGSSASWVTAESTAAVYRYGAVGDGRSHPLGTKYATLAAAQADYPRARSLAEEIDGHAIQRAIDAAGPAGRSVHVPAGTFLTSMPLVAPHGANLTGDSHTGTVIKAARMYAYPVLVSRPPTYPTPPIANGELSGDGSMKYWLNLSDLHGHNHPDFKAFTWEGKVRARAADMAEGTEYAIVNRRGSLTGLGGATVESLRLTLLKVNGKVRVRSGLLVGSTWTYAESADNTFPGDGSLTHIALCYTGRRVQTWVAGAKVCDVAATGTVTWLPATDLVLGTGLSDWPDTGPTIPMVPGAYGPWRTSSNARYSDAAPPAVSPALGFDGDTVAYCDWSLVYDCLVGYQSRYGTHWTVFRWGNWAGDCPGRVERVSLQDGSHGAFVIGAKMGPIRDVAVQNNLAGLYLWNNDFGVHVTGLFVSGGRFGVVLCNNPVLASINQSQVGGAQYGIVASGELQLTSSWVFGYTRAAVLVKGVNSRADLRSVFVTDEGMAQAADHSILLAGCTSFSWSGGGSYTLNSRRPALLTLDSVRSGSIKGVVYGTARAAEDVIHFTPNSKAPARKVTVEGFEQFPENDTPLTNRPAWVQRLDAAVP